MEWDVRERSEMRFLYDDDSAKRMRVRKSIYVVVGYARTNLLKLILHLSGIGGNDYVRDLVCLVWCDRLW
jgi:hypothetical protein